MIIIEELERTGFFRLIGLSLVRRVNYNPAKLMVLFMGLSAFTAAFIDEVTSILIISAMILRVCGYLRINPVPYIITAVMATNIGSAMTVMGNPVGILVALRAGLTFEEYVRWSTPIAITALAVIIPICLLYYHKFLKGLSENLTVSSAELEQIKIAEPNKFRAIFVIFLATITLIALHHRIELLLGMGKNTMLVSAPLLSAGIIMLIERGRARDIVENGVDWWTLLFFMFLFAMAGTLEYTGVTMKMAQGIMNVTGGDFSLILSIVLWSSAFLSGGIDNVPVISALINVVKDLGMMGVPTYHLWWALVFGGCFGGNLTMVGSTANIVCLGVLEKARQTSIGFLEWFKLGFIIVMVTISLSHILLLLQIPIWT